jgi:dTDP-4-amino-4,6-dideoxygalactose transaminase
MDALTAIAERHGLWVVEDAAEAHGARYRGRRAGTLSSIGTFSFYGNKIMTSGEGGALTVDDEQLAGLIRLYRGQGVDPDRRYHFKVVGYNYRLTNVACALLCAQLERIDELILGRQRVFDLYASALDGIPGIGFQPIAIGPSRLRGCTASRGPSSLRTVSDELMTELGAAGSTRGRSSSRSTACRPTCPRTGRPRTCPSPMRSARPA